MPTDTGDETEKQARRQKALAELQRLTNALRTRIDPALLARIGRGVAPSSPGSLPYDKDAATRAIEIFLAAHKDKAGFTARLFRLMQKKSH